MKSLILTASILIAATTTYANTNPTISLDQNKTLVVNLNDWVNSDVKITIEDLEGAILHTEKFQNGTALGRKYNLSNLPFGNYNLIIENSTKKTVHALIVETSSIKMESFRNTLSYKPHVAIRKGAIELNHLALKNKVRVSISNSTDVLFEKSFADQAAINSKFDLRNLPKGEYVFTVEGKDEYYSFPFTK